MYFYSARPKISLFYPLLSLPGGRVCRLKIFQMRRGEWELGTMIGTTILQVMRLVIAGQSLPPRLGKITASAPFQKKIVFKSAIEMSFQKLVAVFWKLVANCSHPQKNAQDVGKKIVVFFPAFGCFLFFASVKVQSSLMSRSANQNVSRSTA